MKSTWKAKKKLFLLSMVLCVVMLTMPVFAETTTQDGLEVSLTTNKNDYTWNEQIDVTLSVTNKNDFASTNIILQQFLPAGYIIREDSETTIHIETLGAGETVSCQATYVPDSAANFGRTDVSENEHTGGTTSSDRLPAEGGVSSEKNRTDTVSDKNGNNNISSNKNGDNLASSGGKHKKLGDLIMFSRTDNADSKNIASDSGKVSATDGIVKTGDSSQILLWVVILVIAIAIAVILMILLLSKKKTGGRFLSLVLCTLLTGSAVMGTTIKANAEEPITHAIDMQTTVKVDNSDLILEGIVHYDSLNHSSEVSEMNGLEADDTYFISDTVSPITFTVNVKNPSSEVRLFDSNQVLGEMHDDGRDGDIEENDGIYSYTLSANYPEGQVEFIAKSGDVVSNTETVEFFAKPTEELRDAAQEIQEGLNGINEEFATAEGAVPVDMAEEATSAAIEYAETLVADGLIESYEVSENSVILNVANGLILVFAPELEGTYSVGSDTNMTVYTFQPWYDWVHSLQDNYIALPTNVSNEADLIPTAARTLSDMFDNCSYSSSAATRNQAISFADIKGIGKNQIVLWQGHGNWAGDKIHSVLYTMNEFDWDAWLWDPVYFINHCAKRIVNVNGYECISSKYIDRYCGNMDNTYIYLGPCESGHDSVLAQSFLNKGASAVIGNTHSVLCLYGDMMEYTTTKLLAEINPDTDNYYTLGEALSKAKSLYGTNDSGYGGAGAEPTIFGGANAMNYSLADVQIGTLSGKICKASDRTTPVSNAEISVYQQEDKCATLTADHDGKYTLNLPSGTYKIVIKSNGYIDFTAYATVLENDNTYLETFLLVEDDENSNGIASGKIYDAVSGDGIKEVKLTVREGWNNSDTGDIMETMMTDSNGEYSLSLPLGNYTVCASKNGYISNMINIVVRNGVTNNQNGTLTAIMENNSYRIVLTWGENPRDLDSHVEGLRSDQTPFHVYYSNMYCYDGEQEICNLDLDDTTSYGPETISLKTMTAEPFYYYIHRYAGSGTVASSGAQIKVYKGDNLLTTYNVPTDQSDGDYWNVFAIKGGRLIDKNVISDSPDISYAITEQ